MLKKKKRIKWLSPTNSALSYTTQSLVPIIPTLELLISLNASYSYHMVFSHLFHYTWDLICLVDPFSFFRVQLKHHFLTEPVLTLISPDFYPQVPLTCAHLFSYKALFMVCNYTFIFVIILIFLFHSGLINSLRIGNISFCSSSTENGTMPDKKWILNIY